MSVPEPSGSTPKLQPGYITDSRATTLPSVVEENSGRPLDLIPCTLPLMAILPLRIEVWCHQTSYSFVSDALVVIYSNASQAKCMFLPCSNQKLFLHSSVVQANAMGICYQGWLWKRHLWSEKSVAMMSYGGNVWIEPWQLELQQYCILLYIIYIAADVLKYIDI